MAADSADTVAILHSAVPADAGADDLDTLVQRDAVSEALSRLGLKPVAIPLDLDLASAAARLGRVRPAVVFNLVESVDGSDALLPVGPMLLEHLGLPYTGCAVPAICATTDKLLAKRLMQAADIPTPPLAGGADDAVLHIVKSVTEHASHGLDEESIVAGRDLARALAERTRRHGGRWFAERFVAGREFNLALLEGPRGVQMLPPAEIELGKGARIVGYAAKWDEESAESRATPRRIVFGADDAPLLAELAALAHRCWDTFGLQGYARVDFRVDREGRPFVLEVNANPCLSPDAGFIAAAARAGLSFDEVVARLVGAARRSIAASGG